MKKDSSKYCLTICEKFCARDSATGNVLSLLKLWSFNLMRKNIYNVRALRISKRACSVVTQKYNTRGTFEIYFDTSDWVRPFLFRRSLPRGGEKAQRKKEKIEENESFCWNLNARKLGKFRSYGQFTRKQTCHILCDLVCFASNGFLHGLLLRQSFVSIP